MDFVTFLQNRKEMYRLLVANRERLAPWFWWAARDVTPNKYRFYRFIVAYWADTKFERLLHRFDPTSKYSEQFIVYNDCNHIGGFCGLDDIDITKHRAEVWGLAFRGNTETAAALKILEDYCINTLKLDSFYAYVQSTNRASRIFWEKYGYDTKELHQNVMISRRNRKRADIYKYTKQLSK